MSSHRFPFSESNTLSCDGGDHGVLPDSAAVCALRGARPPVLLCLRASPGGSERGRGEL